jgi:hypothetical protein
MRICNIDDVCVIKHKNIVSQLDVGDIVVVVCKSSDFIKDAAIVQISNKEAVFMHPGFLKKIGTL